MLHKRPIKPFSEESFQPWSQKFRDVKLKQFGAAEQWLTGRAEDLVWHRPHGPCCSWAMVAVVLWHPGGSFSLLCFPKEKWLLSSCPCYLLDEAFRLVPGSLRDAGVQSRFPVLRSSFSYTPFPKSSLIPETPCSQDKLSLKSKHYANAL